MFDLVLEGEVARAVVIQTARMPVEAPLISLATNPAAEKLAETFGLHLQTRESLDPATRSRRATLS